MGVYLAVAGSVSKLSVDAVAASDLDRETQG